MLESTRKKIIITVALSVLLLIILGVTFLFQTLRSQIEPKPEDIQNAITEGNNITTQLEQNLQNINLADITTTPSKDIDESVLDEANGVIDVEFYKNFAIQDLSSGFSLLEVKNDLLSFEAFAGIIDTPPVIAESAVASDVLSGYFILDNQNSKIYFLGMGTMSQFTQISLNNTNYWFFHNINSLGKSQIYTVNQNFTTLLEYKIPENENIETINTDPNGKITITYKTFDTLKGAVKTLDYNLQNMEKLPLLDLTPFSLLIGTQKSN